MIKELSTLYELALSIGTSLDIVENSQKFLSTLVEKTTIEHASVWLMLPNQNHSKTNSRVFEAPFRQYANYSVEAIKKVSSLGEESPIAVWEKSIFFSNVPSTSIVAQSANNLVVYTLGHLGVMLLEVASERKNEENSILHSIQHVMDKFVLSLEACLAYEQSITETERRKAIQKELEESEEKYRTVVDNIAEGLVITDLDDNLIFVNKQMGKLSGYDIQDIIGQKACDVLVPEAYREDYNSKTLKRKQGESEQYEIPLKNKEGEKWIASISASPYQNTKGEVIGTIAAINDISNRKKIELAVLRSEEKYKSIIENMELGLLEVDSQDRIIRAFPKFCELTGYEEHEIIGKTATDIFLDDEGRAQMNNELNARTEGRSGVYEIQVKKKNGDWIWVMISAAPYYDDDDKIIGSLGIHLDITQRKRVEQEIRDSQEKLQLILNTSLDAIITIDENSIVTDWSPSAEKIFGYCQKEAIGVSLDELIVPKHMISSHQKGMGHFMKTGEGPVLNKRIELTAIRNTGEEFPLELTISPIKIDNRYYFSAFCRDITARKQSEQALIDAKKAAEQARNVERQFLAHMSHEIRTPMNAVIGMTYLLSQSSLSEEQKDYLEALKFSADSLMGIISDILDLSKIEAGEIELEERPFSLHHLLESLQRTYQFKVQEKNISVQMMIDDAIQNQVIGDKTRLHQILGNLLSNASKFTSEGYIGVNGLLERVEDDFFWLKFQVYDTGIGISQDNLGVIFSSFKQATIDTHREFGGTGLGLSIVKQLVEIQGGCIHVESELGKGTMFEVILPFKDSGINTQQELTTDIQLQEEGMRLEDLTILIAEDNSINQKLITSILSQWGIQFDLAENGLEAVAYADKKLYDVIFMDINMPKMNGHEAVRAIKKTATNLNFETPIIALTAAALQEERRRMFEAGVHDFITKPFSPQQLKQTIYSCLDKSLELDAEFVAKPVEVKVDIELYNLSHLNKFSRGNNAFVHEMIQMFLDENPQTLKHLKKAYQDDLFDKVRDLAHQLKSTFGTMGMRKQQEMAQKIEHHFKSNGIQSEEYEKKIQQLIVDCKEVYPYLKNELLV